MTLDELLSEIGEEKAKVVSDALAAEKQKGITETRKKGEDVKKWMTEANKLRDALKAGNLDPESDDLADKLAALTAKPGTDQTETVKLQKMVEAMNKKLADKDAELASKQQRIVNAKLTEVLAREFGEAVPAREYVIRDMIARGAVKLDEAENPVYVDGDNVLDIKAGVDGWKKANPAMVVNSQTPGSGGKPQGGGGSKVMKMAAFNEMGLKEKEAYMKDGGKLTD